MYFDKGSLLAATGSGTPYRGPGKIIGSYPQIGNPFHVPQPYAPVVYEEDTLARAFDGTA